jgi:hypothetical protein
MHLPFHSHEFSHSHNLRAQMTNVALADYPAAVWLQQPQPLIGIIEHLHRFGCGSGSGYGSGSSSASGSSGHGSGHGSGLGGGHPPTEHHPHADVFAPLIALARALVAKWAAALPGAARVNLSTLTDAAEAKFGGSSAFGSGAADADENSEEDDDEEVVGVMLSAPPAYGGGMHVRNSGGSGDEFEFPPRPIDDDDDGASALDYNAGLGAFVFVFLHSVHLYD